MKDAPFMALPDNAVVQFQGKQTTKGSLRLLEEQVHRDTEAQLKAVATQAKAKFQARRVQFLQQQQTEIQTMLAKARAEATRLKQALVSTPTVQQESIRREAIMLMQRSKVATPAEHAQIDQRALQLQQQSLPLLTPQVTVPRAGGNLGALCKLVDCEVKITKVVPFVSMIIPGGSRRH